MLGRQGPTADRLRRRGRSAGASRGHFKARTTTDLGASFTSSVSPLRAAPPKAVGCTAFGASNVLCAFIEGAVRTRPETDLDARPASFTVRVTAWPGLVLASER